MRSSFSQNARYFHKELTCLLTHSIAAFTVECLMYAGVRDQTIGCKPSK